MKNEIDSKNLYEMFSDHVFFEYFTLQDFERFISTSSIRNFGKKEFVFEKYDESNAMYLVLDGIIKIVSFSGEGKEIIMNRMYPGEIFGEIALIDGGERTASAYCAERSSLLAIERRSMFAFLEAYPKFYKAIINQLCAYLRVNTENIEDSAFLDRYQKIAKRILRAKEKQNTEGPIIKMSQEELANMLGFSREIVNKSLQDMQEQGLIALQRSKIEVLNDDGLLRLIEKRKL